jgi:hypothetical protein
MCPTGSYGGASQKISPPEQYQQSQIIRQTKTKSLIRASGIEYKAKTSMVKSFPCLQAALMQKVCDAARACTRLASPEKLQIQMLQPNAPLSQMRKLI